VYLQEEQGPPPPTTPSPADNTAHAAVATVQSEAALSTVPHVLKRKRSSAAAGTGEWPKFVYKAGEVSAVALVYSTIYSIYTYTGSKLLRRLPICVNKAVCNSATQMIRKPVVCSHTHCQLFGPTVEASHLSTFPAFLLDRTELWSQYAAASCCLEEVFDGGA
jgi:hypothetical protein